MFNGEIVFDIADEKSLDIDFGDGLKATKLVHRGDVIALGRKAPKNRWMYKVSFNDVDEYAKKMNDVANKLCSKADYINELIETYDEVGITVYMRSDYAEMGYSISPETMKKLAMLNCPLDFSIISFGMAEE